MLYPFSSLLIHFNVIICSIVCCHGFIVSRDHQKPSLLSRIQYSLYDDQEAAITQRGEYEERIMKPSTPLSANQPRGSGSSGGFGGKGSKNTSAALKEQANSHAKVLREQGVVRIDNVLSTDLVDELHQFVHALRATAEKEVADQIVERRNRFADVLLRKNRCDLTLPLTELTYKGLYALLCNSPVGETLQNLLGEDAVLYEFSCLISEPGSDRQVIHPDTPIVNNDNEMPVLYTCFVSLQDMTMEMGPTCWMPGTHTKEVHEAFQMEQSMDGFTFSPKDQLLQNRASVLGVLPKGCCGIFDSRLLHAGTANRSDRPRAILYVSFKNPTLGYPGNPASIRPDLNGKLNLRQLQKELTLFRKGKGCPELEVLASKQI